MAQVNLEGPECSPDVEGNECWEESPCLRNPTCQDTTTTSTHSFVNNLTRDYRSNGPRLSLRLPGGWLYVGPEYRGGQWVIAPARNSPDGLPLETTSLQFHEYGDSTRGYVISAIVKDGNVGYELPPENFALKKERDIDGNVTDERYVYSGPQIYFHNTSYKIKPYGEGWRWFDKRGNWKEYDLAGRFVAAGDRHGTTERLLYGPDGKMAGYADRTGTQVIWFDYDPGSGLLTAIRDAQNRQITLSYDADGRLWTVKDVEQQETHYEYDGADRLQSVFKPNGKESHLTYLLTGDLVSVRDEAGKAYWFDYDYDDRKKEYYTMIKDPEGNVKEVWYDEQGRTIRVDYNGDTKQTIEREDNALIITEWAPDEHGSMVEQVTRKEYDEWNNLTHVYYPDGAEDSYDYEHLYNRLTRIVKKDGKTIRYEYDDAAHHMRVIDAENTADERISVYIYTAEGKLKTTIMPDERTPEKDDTFEITHNDRGDIQTVKDSQGKIWTFNYDEQGRFLSIIEPEDTTTP